MNEEFVGRVQAVVDNIRRVAVVRPDVIKMSLLGLLCQGHVLLDDFPGVGKTLLAKAIASSIQLNFKRIQFTPDLLPTDITGSSIYDPAKSEFRFVPGPIFANIVLADEINRSSPRTQSALLEAMGEGMVTFDGTAYALPHPFFVIATRNLAEAHGTFPLPHSQLDRFLLSLGIGYPRWAEEIEILERHEHDQPALSPVLTAGEILTMQAQVLTIKVARPVKEYIANIVSATRTSPEIAIGVSPRGAVSLQKAAQGKAAIEGRNFTTPDDVKTVATAVLRHRIIPRSATHDSAAKCIEAVLNRVIVPI